MADPRIAPVEDNLEAFFHDIVDSPAITAGHEPDVGTYWTDIPFPLFNAIAAARFAPGTVERRAREVIAPYVDRGLPFLWWATPSGHAEELTDLLPGLGFLHEAVPGMHVALDGPVDPRLPDGVTIRSCALDDTIDLTIEGFGMPPDLTATFSELFGSLDPDRVVQLEASLDGTPVAAGTVWVTGTTAGLYNIATLEAARGRGVGQALTAALMEAGRRRGCTEAVLHASELGRPVYERLGFVEVCQVPQFVWLPPGA